MNRISDFNLKNKKVLIRADLNVPIKSGIITSDNRIQASLPTIIYALKEGAKVMVTSHLGRPEEGHFSIENSLEPVAKNLSQKLNQEVPLIKNWTSESFDVDSGSLVVLENCRFNRGETANNSELSKKYAELADIFVMDAFGSAHRKQSSTYGVAEYCNETCAGNLFLSELSALNRIILEPKLPMVAIVGGSKVSTKLNILDALSDRVDQLILGGGIANTFLKAQGFNIGNSLHEAGFVSSAKKIIEKLKSRDASLPNVIDVVCGKQFNEHEDAVIKNIKDIELDDMIFDLGPKSMREISLKIEKAKTILWNGPIGVYEIKQFSKGTKDLAYSIANSSAFSLAGGGDTIAAIETFGMKKDISYITTAGGAFLEFIEGKKLPAIEILEKRAKN